MSLCTWGLGCGGQCELGGWSVSGFGLKGFGVLIFDRYMVMQPGRGLRVRVTLSGHHVVCARAPRLPILSPLFPITANQNRLFLLTIPRLAAPSKS